MEELDIEAKQLQAVILKKEFEHHQKTDDFFDLMAIKHSISDCINLDSSDPAEYRQALQRIIETTTVYPSRLTIQFRWMPWPWDIDI